MLLSQGRPGTILFSTWGVFLRAVASTNERVLAIIKGLYHGVFLIAVAIL
jgi:hypothetical protein